MAQFENKSFTVQMRSSDADSDDLGKRWRETFGHTEPAAKAEPAPRAERRHLAEDRVQLYQLLSEQALIGGALERDQLHAALDVIWRRLSEEERATIQR